MPASISARLKRGCWPYPASFRGKKKPRIVWGIIYGGKVYVPDKDSYVARMINMAGGDYLFKESSAANAAISIESFYAKAKEADIFIYAAFPGNVPSIRAIVNNAPVLGDLKAIHRQRVWSFQPWYNQTLDKNDQVLLDLATIFHPEVFQGEPVRNFQKVPLK
jgi:iron complex transport system substrate-binding protein